MSCTVKEVGKNYANRYYSGYATTEDAVRDLKESTLTLCLLSALIDEVQQLRKMMYAATPRGIEEEKAAIEEEKEMVARYKARNAAYPAFEKSRIEVEARLIKELNEAGVVKVHGKEFAPKSALCDVMHNYWSDDFESAAEKIKGLTWECVWNAVVHKEISGYGPVRTAKIREAMVAIGLPV